MHLCCKVQQRPSRGCSSGLLSRSVCVLYPQRLWELAQGSASRGFGMRHKSLLIPRNAADGPGWDGRENNSLDARLRVKCCLRGAWETPPEVMAVELQAWTRPRVCEESTGSGRRTAPALDPPDVPKEGSLQFAVPQMCPRRAVCSLLCLGSPL